MSHGHSYLDHTLIQIARHILCATPQCFKILMTGEVKTCLKEDHTASHFLWKHREVRCMRAIQMARGLPETTDMISNLVDVWLIHCAPAYHCLTGGFEVNTTAHLGQGQRHRRFEPYPIAQ